MDLIFENDVIKTYVRKIDNGWLVRTKTGSTHFETIDEVCEALDEAIHRVVKEKE